MISEVKAQIYWSDLVAAFDRRWKHTLAYWITPGLWVFNQEEL